MPNTNEDANKKEEVLTLDSLSGQLKELKAAFDKMAKDAEEEKEKKAEDEDEEEKKAEDEDEDKEKDKDKESAMDSKIKSLSLEIENLKKSGTKSLIEQISKRDSLANQLSKHVGTFDHADKTLDEVAKYGVKKLGLTCKDGHEESVLDGYLAAKKVSLAVAQDSAKKSFNQIEAYLNGDK